MITRVSEWVVKLLFREWTLGDLTILNCLLEAFGMPEESTMFHQYEFCRWRWINRWQELTRQPLNQEAKHAAILKFAQDASAWNSDSQLARSQIKRHAPKCPAGNP